MLGVQPKTAGPLGFRRFGPNRGGGSICLQQGKCDQTISDCTKAIELDPEMASAYGDRAVAYPHQRKLDLALAAYNKTIELDPRDSNAYCSRGLILEYQDQPDQAIEEYARAIELDPT